MNANGIMLSECCGKSVKDFDKQDERGICSSCNEPCWGYDTGLAQPLTYAEMKFKDAPEREEIIEADKDLLTDEQIQNSINDLP